MYAQREVRHHRKRPRQGVLSIQEVRHQHFSNSWPSYFYMYMEASNAADSLKLLQVIRSQLLHVYKKNLAAKNFVAHPLLRNYFNTKIYHIKVFNSKIFWFMLHIIRTCTSLFTTKFEVFQNTSGRMSVEFEWASIIPALTITVLFVLHIYTGLVHRTSVNFSNQGQYNNS